MSLVPSVIRAASRGEFGIRLTFNDNLEKTIDFSHWLNGPVFEPFRDPEYFKTYFIDGGTAARPNGADIAPETRLAHQGIQEGAARRH